MLFITTDLTKDVDKMIKKIKSYLSIILIGSFGRPLAERSYSSIKPLTALTAFPLVLYKNCSNWISTRKLPLNGDLKSTAADPTVFLDMIQIGFVNGAVKFIWIL